jgi:hypothetical protein
MSMRLRGAIIEYDLTEAATILKLSTKELNYKVREGKLRCFYHIGNEYKFHDASLEDNRLRLKETKAPHYAQNTPTL